MVKSVLCFGDSNTHGTRAMRHMGDRRRFARHERWPGVMTDLLGDGIALVEEGHPGRTSVFDDPIEGDHKNGARALKALLESHRPLELVIIMLGTNDLKGRFGVSASDIAMGLEKLVLEIRTSDSGPDNGAPDVLLVSPVPIIETGVLADMFAGGAEKSRALGPKLAAVAERQEVAFLDLAAVAEVDPVDGIHLDAAAHVAIGTAMADKVRSILSL